MPRLSAFTPLGLLRLTSKPSDAEAMYKAKIAGFNGQYGDPPDLHIQAKAYAESIREAIVRSRLVRAGNQLLPSQLVEMLPVREDEYGIAPPPDATIGERRVAVEVAAKLPLGNSRNNIENALRALLGDDFIRYETPDPTDPTESLDYPTHLGDQPQNLQLPTLTPKVIRLVDDVSSLGTISNVRYEIDATTGLPDPYIPHLIDGDVLVVSPDILGGAERVRAVRCQVTGPTSGIFSQVFNIAHHAGDLATTQPWPYWRSTRRVVKVALKSAAAVDPVIRARVDAFMAKAMREVTQWWIVAEEIVHGHAQEGPFLLDSSPLNATPFALAGAPQAISAIVDDTDPSTIRVTFDRPVSFTDQTGVSLSFSVGTPKTIVAASGNGSPYIAYTTSAPIAYTDVLSIVYGGSNNYVDGVGNPLTATTVPVGNNVAPHIADVPNLYEYWDTTELLSAVGGVVDGAAVVSWTGQIAGLVFNNVGSNQPTVNVNHFGDGAVDIAFDGSVPQNLKLLSFDLSFAPTVTAFALLRGNYGGAAGVIFEHGGNYTVTPSTIELEDNGTTGFRAHTLGNVGLDTLSTTVDSLAGSNRHLLEVDYDYTQPAASELTARLDGLGAGTMTASANNTGAFNFDVLSLGARYGGPTFGGTFRIAALGFIKGIPSTATRALIRDYLRARFPAMA